MTKTEFQKRLEELEAKADAAGCFVVPATPLIDPDDIPEEGQS